LLKLIEQRARMLNLNPKVPSGSNATETALNALHSPKFLVVATHGYFMSDVAPVSAITLVSEGMKSDWGADFRAGMDPRMRSMLVLAGANRRYRPLEIEASATDSNASSVGTKENRGKVRYDTDDGLLTAFEARGIDLRDTDIVMLVGCESSLGIVPRREYRGGHLTMATGMGMQVQGSNLGSMVWTLPQIGDQAVAGLPLAFFVAGARSVISSTSTIPVGQSTQLIDDFLEAWLNQNQGSNRYSAFHSAQLNALARARQKGSTHPFQWAGMVYIGPPDDARSTP
jgi:CHAT domain-containing protein